MEIEVDFFQEKVKKFVKTYEALNKKKHNIILVERYELVLNNLKKIASDLNKVEIMDEFIDECNINFIQDISYKNNIIEFEKVLLDDKSDNFFRLEEIIDILDKKLYKEMERRKFACDTFLKNLFNDKKSILDCFNQISQLEELNRKENKIKAMGIKKETIPQIKEYIYQKNKLFESLGVGEDIIEVLLKLNTGTALLDDIDNENVKKWFVENHAGKQIEKRIRVYLD